MQDLKQLEKEQKETLAAAKKTNIMFKTVLDGLKLKESQVESMYDFSAYSDMSMKVEVKTFEDAMKFLKKKNIAKHLMPICLVRDSCASIVPQSCDKVERLKRRELKKADSTNIKNLSTNFYYKIDGLTQYAQSQKVEAYLKIGDIQVELDIKVESDPLVGRSWDTEEHRGYTTVENTRIQFNRPEFNMSIKWYSSNEHPSSFTLYKLRG